MSVVYSWMASHSCEYTRFYRNIHAIRLAASREPPAACASCCLRLLLPAPTDAIPYVIPTPSLFSLRVCRGLSDYRSPLYH